MGNREMKAKTQCIRAGQLDNWQRWVRQDGMVKFRVELQRSPSIPRYVSEINDSNRLRLHRGKRVSYTGGLK